MKTTRGIALTLTFALTILAASASAGTTTAKASTATAKAGAAEIFQSIEKAVAAHDAFAALQSYDPAEAALTEKTLRDIQGALALEDLALHYRVQRVVSNGDSAEAVVFRDVAFTEHGRRQVERRWETVRVRKTSAGWKIVAENERDYMRCDSTDLRVTLSPETGTMRGTSTLRIRVTAPGEDSVLMKLNRGLEVMSVTGEKGRPFHFERQADSIVLPLDRALRTGETRIVKISFAGTLFNESKEQAYSQVSVAPAGSFASWVTNWYPHLEGAGSKSKGTITYTVPDGITVASSGRPAAARTKAGEFVYTVDRPLDFSFAAAKYFHREANVDGVPLGIFLLRGGDAKADLYIKECARTLRYEQELYGHYPFDGYAVVEIPSEETGTLGGSSEQGMNLFPTGVLPDEQFPLLLIAHEMGHSWWGNLVKADAAILDEGLAQMTAVMCLRKFEGEKAVRSYLKSGVPRYRQSAALYFSQFAGTNRDYALGVVAAGSDARAAQHDIADTKGMFVYDMLLQKIGQNAFVSGLQRIVEKFARRDVTLTDLRESWEQSSGADLRPFFQQWFFRTGAPDLAMDATTAVDGRRFVVTGTITQSGEPYDADVDLALASPGKRVVRTVALSGAATHFSFVADEEPKFVVLDPEYKLFRWTPAFRNRVLLAEGVGLLSSGQLEKAIAKLEEFVSKAPESLEGRYRLGLCYEGNGQLAKAESAFQYVLDRYKSLDVYEPAVALSQLHLGQVYDLSGRRDDAVAAYRQALVLADESNSHRDAAAGLAQPYKLPPRRQPPSAEAMARFAGTYDNGKGLKVDVSFSEGVLTIASAGKPPAPLQWIDGSRFGAPGASEVVIEFIGDSAITELDVRLGAGDVIRLPRTK